MINIEYKKSFQQSLKKYNKKQQEDIYKSIQILVGSIDKFHIPHGLGLKLLKSHLRIWEVRVNLDIRILFRYENNSLAFAFTGNHNDIKNYLKHTT